MYLLLLILAILPTALLLFFIYRMDSYEKEPAGLLFGLFAAGAFSVIPILIAESFMSGILAGIVQNSTVTIGFLSFFQAFLMAGLVEEGFKYLFTHLITWKSKEFNFRFDGIVYTVFTSLGFATIENIMYVFKHGANTAIFRAFLSVPGHAFFGVFMGIFYGNAKYYETINDHSRKRKHKFLAFFVPFLLHGFYDFCLFLQKPMFVVIFVVFVIALDSFAIWKVIDSSKKNHALYAMNYSNVYGNVFIPNNYVPYYNMYGASGYAQQLMNGFQNAPMTANQPNSAPGYPNGINHLNNQFGNSQMNQNPYANTPVNQSPYANMQMNQNSYANVPMNQNPYASNQMNQNPYTNNQMNQNSYANNQVNQNSYANNQNPYANHPYGNTQSYFAAPKPMMIYCGNCGSLCNVMNFRCPQCGSALTNPYQQV